MFRTIVAKYEGKCRRCGCAIQVGSKIRYGGYGRTYHLKAQCGASVSEDEGEVVMDEPSDAQTTEQAYALAEAGDEGQAAAVYSTRRQRRNGSTYTRFSSGAEVFVNRNGRCEDAPCCGCCS